MIELQTRSVAGLVSPIPAGDFRNWDRATKGGSTCTCSSH